METEIGKYKVLREVGKGGMGIVYKALEPVGKRTLAIKVLPPTMVDRSTVERFSREARAMARLKHPNIVEVYEVDMTKGNHYFSMEFIEGETLKAILRRKGALSVDESLYIIRQVAGALAYIHKEGMIHRDIKPGNIMITTGGQVKVMDLGLVQIAGVTRITAEGSTIGTAEYMSPEQISDDAIDSRSDIYSLGVTMYEMLTGKSPFRAETIQATAMKHKYEVPPSVRVAHPEIPLELERITNKAIAKDVAQRYQRIEELIEDINKFKGEPPLKKNEQIPPGSEDKTVAIQREKPAKSKGEKKANPWIGIFVFIGILAVTGYFLKEEIAGLLSKFSQKGTKQSTVTKGKQNPDMLATADEHYIQGLEYSSQGLFDEAIREYEKAIELRDDYALYYKDLAVAYEKKGEIKKAVNVWQTLLARDPNSPFAKTAASHLKNLGE